MKLPVKIHLLIICAVLFGCSTGTDVARIPAAKPDRPAQALKEAGLAIHPAERSEPTYDSIHFYTMGEMTSIMGDYHTAYGLFYQADMHDPENITIKERILATLYILAQEDRSRYLRIVELAEDYLARDLYSLDIIRLLGLSYFQTGRSEDGLKMMRLALDLEPSPHGYYDYFLYLLRYGNRIDFLFLELALKEAYKDPELVYSIARIYEHHNPLRTKEILETAVKKIGDKESHERLISFYIKYSDWQSFTEFIRIQLDKNVYVSEENRITLLEILFSMEDYESINSIYNHYTGPYSSSVLELFFFAAYLTEEYDRAADIGKRILRDPDIENTKRDLMLAYLGEINALSGDYESAAEYLKQINNLNLTASVIISEYESEEKGFDAEMILNTLLKTGYDQGKIVYLRANYYAAGGNETKGLTMLQDFISDPENRYLLIDDQPESETLLKNIAVFFLEYEQTENAQNTLDLITDPDFCSFGFIGSYFHSLDMTDLAIEYYSKSIETRDLPASSVFLSLASLFNEKKEHEKELQLMEIARLKHPEDPLILNWLGYSLIMHTNRFDEAEEYLLKAISINPDSYHIQDSVAWLYYKKEDYEKALSYMQDIISNGVEDSVVAYHIGMIYYQLNNKDEAVSFLQEAVILGTDENYMLKAEQKIKEIGNSYE